MGIEIGFVFAIVDAGPTTSMEIDHEKVLPVFLAEAEENLSAIEEGLLQLEARPDATDQLDSIFRAAHTLKGNSSSLGFNVLAATAHEVEQVLDGLRNGDVRPDGDLISQLLAAVDTMKRWLPELRFETEEQAPAPVSPGAAPALPGEGADEAKRRTIRLDARRMDSLLDLASEITIAADRTRRKIQALPAELRHEVVESVEEQDRLLRDLHETVMSCRMVPIGPIFRRHVRTVRDLERATGKQVRLTLEGEDVEIDMTVIEALADPLVHLIRNAVDHGIESPPIRRERGKNPIGDIHVSARHERGTIVVNVVDDGGGIDVDKVRARAAAMGLPAQSMSDAELLDVIFAPGFSTAEAVTATSGRGVGMDVVRRNIERVRGKIHVENKVGLGTTISIRLPLTLALIGGFVVTVGGEMFVLPLSVVDECLERSKTYGDAGASGVMYVRGDAVPFISMRAFLGFGGEWAGREVVVVVENEDARAGLVVDEVLGEAQIVIKSAGPMLRSVAGVTGTAVMGNGAVAMVIDPALIFGEIQRSIGEIDGIATRNVQ